MSAGKEGPPEIIRSPQDVINLISQNPLPRSGLLVMISLGGVLIDAYQSAMIGFGNKYIAAEFGLSPGLTATVNASVIVAALLGGLLSNRVINLFGQRLAFVIGLGMCSLGSVAVSFVPDIWWLLICRIVMGLGLGIDFPLAASAIAEFRGTASKKSGTSVNLWQMVWYISTTIVYLVLLALYFSSIADEALWRYGIFIGAIIAMAVILLRLIFIGESAVWAARIGRYALACKILAERYNIKAIPGANPVAQQAKPGKNLNGAYRMIFSKKYRSRTLIGSVVSVMQAWQYGAVGLYLPLTLASILQGGLSGALAGSAAVNALCGISGGAIGSVILTRFGARYLSMVGFAVVTVALITLGFWPQVSAWLSLFLLGAIIFFHSAGPGGLGMTIATLSYPPSIRLAGIGFVRGVMRLGGIAGLIFWPMLWGALNTDAFFLLAIIPFIGFVVCKWVKWEPIGSNVDAEDEDVLLQLRQQQK
ncbi:MFS transporter [Enterobacteriaceae bacterium YMB-R22]|uniref:MFS transporter n=1 Tax=Tenebrionicola larvae TaxID=2815733 RepID=UPI00201145FF|nr:MFS transporter [Tenebrionicola larvae]MBV4412827.1 MFS transporter [Tenebrionicola larvae]